ncbi:hypothetical protein ES703_80728 [subsurface metagenome]
MIGALPVSCFPRWQPADFLWPTGPREAPPCGHRGPVACFPTPGQGRPGGDIPRLARTLPFLHPRGRTVARSARSVPGGVDILIDIRENMKKGGDQL